MKKFCKYLKNIFLLLCVLIFLRACVYEPYLVLNLERLQLPAKNWNNNLSDMKIALISDFHAGNRPFEHWRVNRAIEKIAKEKPDIIFLLGDYVNGSLGMSAMPLDELAEILAKLDAPLGIYAVTGNHDIGYGEQKIIKALSSDKIKFLQDENVKIDMPKGSFYLAGLSFAYDLNYNVRKALSGIPEGAPTILLIHSPDLYPALPKNVSISFSGHTHGGQVNLPFYGSVWGLDVAQITGKSYGLMESVYDNWIYITKGIGTSTITVRLLCEPQVEIITLKNSK